MKISVYCIYDRGQEYPKQISMREPKDIDSELIVCQFPVDMSGGVVDVKYDKNNEYYPKGSLFCVYEMLSNGEEQLLGSDQGYSHKHAKSLVRNLEIAYPNNTYVIKRKFTDKTIDK